MADVMQRYMTVKVTFGLNAVSLDVWLSTVDFWLSERATYKYAYTYMGDRCTWLIHSDHEITQKMLAMVGEQADRMCSEGATTNAKRKVSNR